MFKMIFLLVGLAVGFGGGVYWGQKNPQAAANLSAEEERRVLEAKLAVTEKFRQKLDQLQNKSSTPAGSSGFVGSGQTNSAAQVNELKQEAQQDEEQLRQQLAKVKK